MDSPLSNVLATYFDCPLFYTPMQSICQEMISHIPASEDLNELYNYLQEFWMNDHGIKRLVDKLGKIGCDQPSLTPTVFLIQLPTIDINGTSPPQQQKDATGLSFVNRMQGIDWKSKNVRIAISLLFEVLFAEFIHGLLKYVSPNNLADCFVSIIMPAIKMIDKESDDMELRRFHIISARRLIPAIFLISKSQSDQILDLLIDTLVKAPTMPVPSLHARFCMFLGFHMTAAPPEPKAKDIINGLTRLFSYLQKKNVLFQNDVSFHEDCMNCLANFLGYMLKYVPTLQDSVLMIESSKFAKYFITQNGYSGSAYYFHAIIYSFTKHKKMKRTKYDFCDHYLSNFLKIPSYGKAIIRTFTSFLRGENYANPLYLEETRENYSWNAVSKCDTELCKFILIAVKDNPKTFTDAQEYLAEFILQFGIYNTNDFTKQIIPLFSQKEFSNGNESALLIVGKEILSPNSKYPLDEGYKNKIKEALKNIINSIIISFVKEENINDSKAYQVIPFLTAYRLSNNDFINALSSLTTESNPLPVAPLTTRILSTILMKWQKTLQISKKPKIFESDPNSGSISSYTGGTFSYENRIAAFSLIPIIDIEPTMIENLCKLAISSSPHIGALATRTLQAFFINNSNLRLQIMNKMNDILFNSEKLSYVNIYMIIYNLQLLTDIIVFMNIKFSSEIEKILNNACMFGLLTPSQHIRYLSYSLIQSISKYQSGHSLGKLIETNDNKIGFIARSNAIRTIAKTPRIDTNEFTPIPFSNVLMSSHNNLYQYYLAAFSSLIKKVDFHPFVAILENQNIPSYVRTSSLICLLNHSSKPDILDKMINDKTLSDLIDVTLFSSSSSFDYLRKTHKSLRFRNAQAYSIHAIIENQFNQINQDFIDKMFPILTEIQEFLINESIMKMELTFSVDTSKIDNYHQILHHFLMASTLLLSAFKALNFYVPHGPYLLTPIVLKPISKDFKIEQWFIFISNLTDEKYEDCLLAHKALSAFIHICPPPEKYFNTLVSNFTHFQTPTLAMFLLHYSKQLLPSFIQNAIDDQMISIMFFDSIIYLMNIVDSEKFFDEWQLSLSSSMTKEEEEFARLLYSFTGSLFALGFLFIVRSNKKIIKTRAFVLLMIVAMGSSVVANKPRAAARIYQVMKEYQYIVSSQLSELCLSALVSISSLFAFELGFCTEQFIYNSFVALAKNPSLNNQISRIVAPWIRDIKFEFDTPVVFKQTEPIFTQYTSFSLIKQLSTLKYTSDLAIIYDNLLIGDTESFVPLALFSVHQSQPELSQNLTALLSYIFTQKPAETADVLINIFKFSAWFYFEVELNAIDEEFDMDDFLKNLRNRRTMSLVANKREGSQNSNYVNAVTFMVSIMASVMNDAPSLFRPYHYILFAFCLIMLDNPFINIQPLLKTLIPKTFISESIDIEDNIFSLIQSKGSNYQECFTSELLSWGLCCGNINYAKRALSIYLAILNPINEEILNGVFKSFKAMMSYINHVSTQKNDCITYLLICLQIIRAILVKKKLKRMDIFWYLIKFLSIKGDDENIKEFYFILVSTLTDIIEINGDFDEKPDNFTTIMGLIVDNLSENSAEMIYTLICMLIKAGKCEIVSSSPKVALFISFSLKPLFSSSIVEPNMFNLFSDYIEDKNLISHLVDMANIDAEAKDTYIPLVVSLSSYLDDKELTSAFDFITRIINALKFKEAPFFYKIVVDILGQNKDANCFITFASTTEVCDTDESHLLLKNTFIDIFKQTATIKSIPAQKSTKEPVFPVTSIAEEFENWKPKPDSHSFSNISSFPPLKFQYDQSKTFNQLPSAAIAKQCNQLIHSQPFNKWSDLMFKAQSLEIETDGEKDIKILTDIEAFMNRVEIELNVLKTPERAKISHQKSNHLEAAGLKQNDPNEISFNTLDPLEFTMTGKQLMEIGKDVLASDLPINFIDQQV